MPFHDVAKEAAHCRLVAKELQGRPEVPVLLKLACEFDRLGERRKLHGRDHAGNKTLS